MVEMVMMWCSCGIEEKGGDRVRVRVCGKHSLSDAMGELAVRVRIIIAVVIYLQYSRHLIVIQVHDFFEAPV